MRRLIPYDEILYTCCFFAAFIFWKKLITQDERTQTLSGRDLKGLFAISIGQVFFAPCFSNSFLLLIGGSFLLYKVFPLFLKRSLLGRGDVELFSCCGLWLPVSFLPLFLIIVGSVGCLRCLYLHQRRIPFALPIFCGWSVCTGILWGQECGVVFTFYWPLW
ncbi:MAG: A24 family peptidase [Holosporales bacterium]|nr:A24 family peptidase [Holosporales bacterium]